MSPEPTSKQDTTEYQMPAETIAQDEHVTDHALDARCSAIHHLAVSAGERLSGSWGGEGR